MHPRPAPPVSSHLSSALREPGYHEYGAWSAPLATPSPAVQRQDFALPIIPRRGPASLDNEGSDQEEETPSGRKRSLTTPFQAQVLRAFITITRFPATALRDEVGQAIGLSGRQVQVWFQVRGTPVDPLASPDGNSQNQRQKARKLLPAIDLDNDGFPLKALLASQPLASSSYSTLTQKAIPHVLALNEEIKAALHQAGITGSSQHLTPEALDVIARYCGSSGGAGTRSETPFVSSPVPLSATSKYSIERSRMPPPIAPVPRVASSIPGDSGARASAYHTHNSLAGSSQTSASLGMQSSIPSPSSSHESMHAPPSQATPDPDLVLPRLREANIRDALARAAASRPLELETESSPRLDAQGLAVRPSRPYPTRVAEVHSPPLSSPTRGQPQAAPLTVLLHPPTTKARYIPEPLQVIPRQALQRERIGVPEWWAHGPVDDAALDPVLVDSLRRMGVMGNRRRPFLPPQHQHFHPYSPQERDRRRWLWGQELRPRRNAYESASWEWEWEVPGLEVPESVSRRPSRRASLVGTEGGDKSGLFTWLSTGRYSGKPFVPANNDPVPQQGSFYVRGPDGRWKSPPPPPPH